EKGDLHAFATAFDETLQVVSLVMHPETRIVLVEVAKERESRLQLVGVKTGRRKEIKIFGHAVPELQCEGGSAIEHKIGRHRIEFRPEFALGLWKDVHSGIE